MMANRRLALSLLCAVPLSAALMTAVPAVAAEQAPSDPAACGASSEDYAGTFGGTFENDPGAALEVRFAAPHSVETTWNVRGWGGSGQGKFDVDSTGAQWTNSSTVSGPLTGVDSEVYRSVQVRCEDGGSQVTSIAGVVDSGDAQIPFAITRR
jgi:opacity protein-like surface antigen